MSKQLGRPKSATLGVNTLVRLPPDLRAQLEQEAKKDNRTLSGHIRQILVTRDKNLKATICNSCEGKGTYWMGLEAEVECSSCEGSGTQRGECGD